MNSRNIFPVDFLENSGNFSLNFLGIQEIFRWILKNSGTFSREFSGNEFGKVFRWIVVLGNEFRKDFSREISGNLGNFTSNFQETWGPSQRIFWEWIWETFPEISSRELIQKRISPEDFLRFREIFERILEEFINFFQRILLGNELRKDFFCEFSKSLLGINSWKFIRIRIHEVSFHKKTAKLYHDVKSGAGIQANVCLIFCECLPGFKLRRLFLALLDDLFLPEG